MRRALRYGIRLGLLGGIAFALFRIFDSRRHQQSGGSEGVRPPAGATTGPAPATMASAGPGPVPATPVGVPAEPPDPDLVDPVMLTSIGGLPREGNGDSPDNGVGTLGGAPPAPEAKEKEKPAPKKAAPVKKAAAKKAAPRKEAEPEKPENQH